MLRIKWIAIILLALFFYSNNSCAKLPSYYYFDKYFSNDTLKFLENSPVPNKSRIRTLNYSIIAGYGLSMTWLYSQWYSDYARSSFHFFNDNSEWEQMDKFGHFWDAYNIAKPLMRCYHWAGFNEKKATLYGVGIAFLFQTTIEVFDGFAPDGFHVDRTETVTRR